MSLEFKLKEQLRIIEGKNYTHEDVESLINLFNQKIEEEVANRLELENKLMVYERKNPRGAGRKRQISLSSVEELMKQGKKYAQIAEELNVSIITVKRAAKIIKEKGKSLKEQEVGEIDGNKR